MNEEAAKRYIYNMQRIEKASAAITQYATDVLEVIPDDITWGHVGTAAKIAADLEEVAKGLNV